MGDLLANVTKLGRLGIRLRVLSQGIETDHNTPMGQLALKVFCTLAEFERDTRIRRVRARMAEAGRRGKMWGRPPRVFPREVALELRSRGTSWRAISHQLGVPQSTVRAAVSSLPGALVSLSIFHPTGHLVGIPPGCLRSLSDNPV